MDGFDEERAVLFLDDRIGSIEVGKRADVVVVDGDLETRGDGIREGPSTDVWLTLIDGRAAYAKDPALVDRG